MIVSVLDTSMRINIMNCKQSFVGSTGSLQPGTSIQNTGKQKAEMAEHPVKKHFVDKWGNIKTLQRAIHTSSERIRVLYVSCFLHST